MDPGRLINLPKRALRLLLMILIWQFEIGQEMRHVASVEKSGVMAAVIEDANRDVGGGNLS
ncbi:MAG TPA: hypothetical protein VIM11_25780 [Tepidisphaeraceae bacterium]|jgi:hypothetical protein